MTDHYNPHCTHVRTNKLGALMVSLLFPLCYKWFCQHNEMRHRHVRGLDDYDHQLPLTAIAAAPPSSCYIVPFELHLPSHFIVMHVDHHIGM